ncbi:DUF6527 family protein [Micropruina glycogenica]|uniref:Uncharacterized protein n=1 Tax=Micropruina glycogenica TaxID=75385 RepID=A0A2N9JJG6_9ACTN|nr:DUF6527 family protein [Micropruina glycogenica]SPD88195.1 conserved protein of unknown function [Micropruina glycogenica]
MGILKSIRYWRRWKADLSTSSAADIPVRLPVRRAVVVESAGRPKWLIFDCPCDRGHRVMLNLDRGNRPLWRIADRYPLTLYPSVDERSSVGHCHYVVRDGYVRWIERTDHR